VISLASRVQRTAISGAFHLCNVSSNNGCFREYVQKNIQPFREIGFAMLREVHASYGAQLDAQGLQKDGNEI
jgi:hypothetical protein